MSSNKTGGDKGLSVVLPPVRCTEEQKQQIKTNALNAGLSMCAFIRKAALGQTITAPPSTVDLDTLNELRRIGVNLNQQSRRLNATGIQPAELRSSWVSLQSVLERLMEKI